MSIEVEPATAARFDDVATMLGPENPQSSVCWCLSHRVDVGTRALFERAGNPQPGSLPSRSPR